MAFFLRCRCLACGKYFKIIVDGAIDKHIECVFCNSFNTIHQTCTRDSSGKKVFSWSK